MKSEFVELYNEELSELRQKGVKFADSYPKVASRLKLGQGAIEDPLVGRLLESFAFLSAGIKQNVQYERDQLSQQLTQLLYPNYYLL